MFSDDLSNNHVNNLLTSTTKDTEGWDINMSDGKWKNNQVVENICGPNWYGWTASDSVGTISTTLYKDENLKCGRLDFGNCWTSGAVTVYLNGELIGKANANTPSKIIEFPILTDSQLEILDEGLDSVIRFNKFEMVSCNNMHVNNLLESSTDTVQGWDLSLDYGKWSNNAEAEEKCGPGWYGWADSANVGTISTMLYRNSQYQCGRLDFGNCWTGGNVRVYLNDDRIGEASANTPSLTIEFPVLADSQLEIREEGTNAIIKFNHFEMIACDVDPNGNTKAHL